VKQQRVRGSAEYSWTIYASFADGELHLIPEHNPRQHSCCARCWCKPEVTEDRRHMGGNRMWTHKELH